MPKDTRPKEVFKLAYDHPDDVGQEIIDFTGKVLTDPEDRWGHLQGLYVLRPDWMEQLRQERNAKLAETDFWAYQDTPDMTAEKIAYRQALRDLPANVEDQISVDMDGNLIGFDWPTKPS